MNKSLAIFRRDMRRLLRNPIALVVALGICVVPCLYAWINILANWDPYENTSDIPVAVVSEDQPQEIADMGEICVGDMLVEALAENDKIGWTFVDEEEALQGVRDGTYYAAIVIPPDFTANLTGILDGNIQKGHLKYYVNEKVNAIAPKVTDTGASTIEQQIDSQFVATVGKVIAEKLNGLTDKLSVKAKDVSQNLGDALAEARTTLTNVDGKLGDLETSLTEAQTALDNASQNLAALEGRGTEASDALGDVLDNFDTTRTNASDLMTDINLALGNGASSISSLSSQATYDISAVAGDISLAQAQVNAAIRALENDLTDNQALVTTITNTQSFVANYTPTDSAVEAVHVELSRELTAERDFMVQITDAEAAKLEELRALADKLQTAADEVANLSASIDEDVQLAVGTLQDAQTGSVSTSLQQVNTALDSFVRVAQQLQTTATMVEPIIAQTVDVSQKLANTMGQTNAALEGTRTSMADISDDLGTIEDELVAVRSSNAWSALQSLVTTDPTGIHDFLADVVQINENRLYPVENYASGVAPFFTSLALWVGGIALVAIFKLEVDEDEVGRVRPWQAYFGRWLLFVLLGALQAIICCTGNLLLGIQCAYPWAFYLAAIIASFVFINIIFALSVAFKHLGKALAFTLIILQVPGSAGMYPIEMMPAFFRTINPWLPFTYSNNALREAIAGFYGNDYVHNLVMLLLFVLPAILVGVAARSHLVNINALFDRRLRETDHLMVIEPTAIGANRYRLATVVKAMSAPEEYRATALERSAAFERAYPQLKRWGILALLLAPLALFCGALVFPSKLPLIGAFVVVLVLLYVYLILIEYFHDRVLHKRLLTDLSSDDLELVLNDALREEMLPLAPIDTILEMRQNLAQRERPRGIVGCARKRATRAEASDGMADVPDVADVPAAADVPNTTLDDTQNLRVPESADAPKGSSAPKGGDEQ